MAVTGAVFARFVRYRQLKMSFSHRFGDHAENRHCVHFERWMVWMGCEPIVVCRYGWGRLLRLYQNYLDLNGTSYALSELIRVQPIYRRICGISSVRLEVYFKTHQEILRGIADVAAVQEIVAYLAHRCPLANTDNVSHAEVCCATPVEESVQASILSGRAQNNFWEYSPVIVGYVSALGEQAQALVVALASPPRYLRSQAAAQVHQEQRLKRLKRLQAERSKREHGFDVAALELRLRLEGLPCLTIAPRLLAGEVAHYRTDAVLCGPVSSSYMYEQQRTKDHGMLILTNMRLIYLGRKLQIVLKYAQIVHVIPLHGSVELLTCLAAGRQLFEMRRPLEFTMYLAHILQPMLDEQGSPLLATVPSVAIAAGSAGDGDSETELYASVSAKPLDTDATIRIRANKVASGGRDGRLHA